LKSTGSTALLDEVRRRLSPERFAHVLRVAELARAVAPAVGVDPDKAYRAGLLHDLAKELPDRELLRLAPPENEVERAHPPVLHGRAGRKLAEGLGERDPEVLAAIEGHVVGVGPDFPLGMLIYVADLAEPGRGFNRDLLPLLESGRLLEAYRRAVERKVAYLESRGIPVHPRTREVQRALEAA